MTRIPNSYGWQGSGGGGGVVPGGAGNAVGVIIVPIALITANSIAALTIPGAFVVDAWVDVDVAYSPGTTITVGTPLSPTAFQTAANNTATVINLYRNAQVTAIAVAEVVRVTIAGAPAVGSGNVFVYYTTPSV